MDDSAKRPAASFSIPRAFAITALALALSVVQGPLWRPDAAPRCVTATTGGSAVVEYRGRMEKAIIFQSHTATLSAAGPGRLIIHGQAPGTTSLLISYQGGEIQLYRVVVLPG